VPPLRADAWRFSMLSNFQVPPNIKSCRTHWVGGLFSALISWSLFPCGDWAARQRRPHQGVIRISGVSGGVTLTSFSTARRRVVITGRDFKRGCYGVWAQKTWRAGEQVASLDTLMPLLLANHLASLARWQAANRPCDLTRKRIKSLVH